MGFFTRVAAGHGHTLALKVIELTEHLRVSDMPNESHVAIVQLAFFHSVGHVQVS